MKVIALSDGYFKLDGGTVFGLYPKTIWSEFIKADELNRIKAGLNVFLIKMGNKNILIDSGIGRIFDDKMMAIYEPPEQPNLHSESQRIGFLPKDINIVILTHLHLDHTGGLFIKYNIEPELLFANAEYIIQKKEWRQIEDPNPLTSSSYRKDLLKILKTQAEITLIDGNYNIFDNLSVELTGAHTPGHQIVYLSIDDKNYIFPGDILPTRFHTNLKCVMSYDLEPMGIIFWREKILRTAVEKNAIVCLPHDLEAPFVNVYCENKKYKAIPL